MGLAAATGLIFGLVPALAVMRGNRDFLLGERVSLLHAGRLVQSGTEATVVPLKKG